MNCLKCNSVLKEGEKICSTCGLVVDTKYNKNMSPKRKINIIFISIIVTGIVSILAGLILLITNSKEKNPNNNIPINKEEKLVMGKDWTSLTFSIDGEVYKVKTSYSSLLKNGWFIKPNGLDSEKLKPNEITFESIELSNDDYDGSQVNIGLINVTTEDKKLTDCLYWAISIENSLAEEDGVVKFALPGGVGYGSTTEEIEKVYGKPKNLVRSDRLKKTEYQYVSGNIYFTLLFSDDEGLLDFSFKDLNKK